MNPEDLAASRFRPIQQAHEQIAKAEARHAKSVARVEELCAQIGPAEHRDKQALGKALVAGKAEPASEAAKLKAELEREERRVEAVASEVAASRGRIAELVADNRGGWREQAMRELAKARTRYEDAIAELEAARDALSSEATLVAWLDSGAGVEAASDPLGGRTAHINGRAPMSFAATLEELRRDGDAIAAHPANRDDPHPTLRHELAAGGGSKRMGWG